MSIDTAIKRITDYLEYKIDKNRRTGNPFKIHRGVMITSDMKFHSKEYRQSRRAYMIQCTVEYFVSLLVTDAFLAKLLVSVGVSDSLIGIISSFV